MSGELHPRLQTVTRLVDEHGYSALVLDARIAIIAKRTDERSAAAFVELSGPRLLGVIEPGMPDSH